MAEVEVRRISGCGGGCSSCSGACSAPSITIYLKNSIDAKEGDYVEIKGNANKIIKYALILYMIPFTMLILGIVLGNGLFKSRGIVNYEVYSFVTGIIFLGISFFIIRRIDKSLQKKNENAMEMIKILY